MKTSEFRSFDAKWSRRETIAQVTEGSEQSRPLLTSAIRICVVKVPFEAIGEEPPGKLVTQADGPTPVALEAERVLGAGLVLVLAVRRRTA
ncbi:hypothetical protein [Amycolatopsis sp. lyj-112]|uniref:hypothetical protein n=1 Tax=Amycolatopsis sp. lyj-112 TaxID=2789288 RepID=UPI00397C180B